MFHSLHPFLSHLLYPILLGHLVAPFRLSHPFYHSGQVFREALEDLEYLVDLGGLTHQVLAMGPEVLGFQLVLYLPKVLEGLPGLGFHIYQCFHLPHLCHLVLLAQFCL